MNRISMNGSKYFIALGILLSAVPLCFAERPNILFIIADDASRDSMGVYGSTYVKTPNFDRIAREGGFISPRPTIAIRSVPRPALAC